MNTADRITGCLLGTAVGDALGLPYEGLSSSRALRMLGVPDRHRFLFGRGMFSDDTEHACMVAQSLIATNRVEREFSVDFARRLRRWFLCLPAGVGLATARACVKLCLGFGPQRSGVFSAGNGPAMRSAILGAAVEDLELLKRLVTHCTRVTHTDPKAFFGAFSVALAARTACEQPPIDGRKYFALLQEQLPDGADEFLELVERAAASSESKESTQDFAASLGLKQRVGGYIYHSAPVCLHAWLRFPNNFREAVMSVLACGGDADTTAAIVGGIVGCRVGKRGIPPEWLTPICDWPMSVSWIESLASQLDDTGDRHMAQRSLKLPVAAVVARNVVFLGVVLAHGFRRLAPPY